MATEMKGFMSLRLKLYERLGGIPGARRLHNLFTRLRRLLNRFWCFLTAIPPISYSRITEDLIRKCIEKPDPTILDIGCNDGSTTLWFLKIFENPKIYCFEPDPRAISRFYAKVGHHPNVSLFEIALSDRNGEVTFYQSGGQRDGEQSRKMAEGWDYSGSIKKPKDHLIVHPWVTFNRAVTVSTETLDSWCDAHGIETIDFIWMDVQGAEIDVLRGGINALTKTRFLYTEYSNRELYEGQANLKQLMNHLKDFRVLVRYPDDVLLARRESLKPDKL